MGWLVADPWWKPVAAQRASSPEHRGSAAEHTVEAAAAVLCPFADHTAPSVQDRVEVDLGDLARTCCYTGLAEHAGSVERTGSSACMLRFELLALVAQRVLAVAAEHAVSPCPRSAVALVRLALVNDLSWTLESSVAQKAQ